MLSALLGSKSEYTFTSLAILDNKTHKTHRMSKTDKTQRRSPPVKEGLKDFHAMCMLSQKGTTNGVSGGQGSGRGRGFGAGSGKKGCGAGSGRDNPRS